LEGVKGIFLRDTETNEIITPDTVKYIELGDTLTCSQLGIGYEYYGSLAGGLTWSPSNNTVASVSDYTGMITGNAPGQAIITTTATINGSAYSVSFSAHINPARVLFETAKKPGIDESGDEARDMHVSDLSKVELYSINLVLGDLANLYDSPPASSSVLITQGPEALKNNMRQLPGIFATGDSQMRAVAAEMVEHFLDGSGSNYSNGILTQKVYNHDSTQVFVDNTKQIISTSLIDVNYDINLLLNNTEFWTSLDDIQDPTYNATADYTNGLKLCLNGTWGHKIEILQYAVTEDGYTCRLRYTLYDHFGLDDGDVTASGWYSLFLGHTSEFGSWYVLQRYENCNSQYKPFVTVVSFEETISGSIE
jgi:hypothetical protein